AAKMDDVRFLRQDHAGDAHASAPKVIRRPKLPETEQSENEHHREEHEPHFVDRVASIKNKSGGDRHRKCRQSAHVSSDQWLESQRKPNAANAYNDNRQPQRPKVSAKQSFRQQQNVKMKRPVI